MSNRSLPLTVTYRIDEACDAFERLWSTSERMTLEEVLSPVRSSERADWLLPLLQLEIELRRRNGENPGVGDYESRFPDCGGVVLEAFLDQATPTNHESQDTWIGERTAHALSCPEIDGYQILREAGRGGMGVVYEALQTALNRRVAIKFLRNMELIQKEERDRFLAEAQSLAKLQHPGIVVIYNVGEVPAGPYMVMEFIDGGSLGSRLNGEPLPPGRAAEMLLRIADAIEFAHQHGVIHRDLNPSNILMTAARDVRVSDFGLARWFTPGASLSGSGVVVGTPSYMSPEQARGNAPVGPAADIYGLGAILYEVLTGQPPFRGTSALQTMILVQEKQPVAPTELQPQIPRDLETICLKCLEKEPPRRYATVTALIDDLRRFQSDRPILARPAGPIEKLHRWARRNPAIAGLAATVVIVLLTGLAATWTQLQRAEQGIIETAEQRDLANRNYQRAIELADYLTEISSRDLAGIPAASETRRELLEKALAYYSTLAADHKSGADTTGDIALTLLRLGDLHGALGQHSEAVTRYRESSAILRKRLKTLPDDDQSLRHLAGVCQNLAGLLRFFGPDSSQEALELLTESDRIWEQIAAGKSVTPETTRAWAKCRFSRGVLLEANGDPAAAQKCFAEASAMVGDLLAKDPDDIDASLLSARAFSESGNHLEEQGDFATAMLRHQNAVAVCRRCFNAGPENISVRLELASCLNNLAIVARRLKDLDSARAAYQESIQLTRNLLALDPANADLMTSLSRSLLNLGILEQNDSAWPPAEACFREAIRIHTRLLELAPQNADHREKLSARWGRLAGVQLQSGQINNAVSSIRQQAQLWTDNAEQFVQIAREFAECAKVVATPIPDAGQPAATDSSLAGSEEPAIGLDVLVAETVGFLRQAIRLQIPEPLRILDESAFDTIRDSPEFVELRQSVESAEKSTTPAPQ